MHASPQADQPADKRQQAKARWKMLIGVLKGGLRPTSVVPSHGHGRGSGLWAKTKRETQNVEDGQYEDYIYMARKILLPADLNTVAGGMALTEGVVVRQRRTDAKISRAELSGFDNTGNLCM